MLRVFSAIMASVGKAVFDWKGWAKDEPPGLFATTGTGIRVYRLLPVVVGGKQSFGLYEVPYTYDDYELTTNTDVAYPVTKTAKMWNIDSTKIVDIDWWYYGYSVKVGIGFNEKTGQICNIEVPCLSFSEFGSMYTKETFIDSFVTKIPPTDNIHKQRESFRKMYEIMKASKEKPKHDFVVPHVIGVLIKDAIACEQICPVTHAPIDTENACVTSCGHIFSKEGILHALVVKDECPICSKKCYLVN